MHYSNRYRTQSKDARINCLKREIPTTAPTWKIGSEAEDEVLFAAGPLVTLLDDRIDVRVDLGECQLTDLTLGIEPFRLVVSGRIKTEVENEDNAFFRLVALPGEIDPFDSSAAVYNACLCVTLPRMEDAHKCILL